MEKHPQIDGALRNSPSPVQPEAGSVVGQCVLYPGRAGVWYTAFFHDEARAELAAVSLHGLLGDLVFVPRAAAPVRDAAVQQGPIAGPAAGP